jgi:hypothetical protein
MAENKEAQRNRTRTMYGCGLGIIPVGQRAPRQSLSAKLACQTFRGGSFDSRSDTGSASRISHLLTVSTQTLNRAAAISVLV